MGPVERPQRDDPDRTDAGLSVSSASTDQIDQEQICVEISEKDNFPDGPNEGSVFDDIKKPYWYEYRDGKWNKKERS